LAPALCGCETDRLGAPPLTVNLAALKVCERILMPVTAPVVTAQTDARVAFLEADAALAIARGEIRNGRHCVADVRQRYGGKAASVGNKAARSP
jgi:hypothetical protein